MWQHVLGAASIVGVAFLMAAGPMGGRMEGMHPASSAYMQGMEAMQQAMQMPMTGDPDQDFAQMMIAHHQGAIDMARVELEYGTDPELRARAQAIIDDQGKEIEELKLWQQRHRKVQ